MNRLLVATLAVVGAVGFGWAVLRRPVAIDRAPPIAPARNLSAVHPLAEATGGAYEAEATLPVETAPGAEAGSGGEAMAIATANRERPRPPIFAETMARREALRARLAALKAKREAARQRSPAMPLPKAKSIVTTAWMEDPRRRAESETSLFFQTVPVDDATRETLLRIVVDEMMENADIGELALAQHLSFAESGKLRRESFQRYKQHLTAVLGEEYAGYFMDFKNASFYAPITKDFAARCAAQGEPVNVAAMAAVGVNFLLHLRSPSGSRLVEMTANGSPANESRALAMAEKRLTPGQFRIFRQVWSERPYAVAKPLPR